jgi:phosphonoacetaldehyde methylase
MPGETLEDIEEGFAYAGALSFDSLAVFAAQAIPGSELYEQTVSAGGMTRLQGRVIDTSRDAAGISTMGSAALSTVIKRFLSEFNATAKLRDPVSWNRKYGAHLGRLRKICVGEPAPNTSSILEAAGM